MFTVTPPTKRPASPSSTRDAKHPRTSFSPTTVSSSSLRNMLENLSREQLQSVIMQTAQFNPSAKRSIHSLVSSLQTEKAKDFTSELTDCLGMLDYNPIRMTPSQLADRASEVSSLVDATAHKVVAGVQALTRNGVGSMEQRRTTWLNGYRVLISLGRGALDCENRELSKRLRCNGVFECIAECMRELLVDAEDTLDMDNMLDPRALEQATTALARRVQAYGIEDLGHTSQAFQTILAKIQAEAEEAGSDFSDY